MTDLTIIFLTANEHPEHWQEFHWQKLKEAAGDFPIIHVVRSRTIYTKLKAAGWDVILDEEPQSHYNMYRQLLKACKMAKTPFIATAESDTLYPPDHFAFFRPKMNEVAYDMSRWTLFTWKPDLFSLRFRISNCTLIAPREYYIEALEERYGDNSKASKNIVGEVGRHLHENVLGITPRNCVQPWCKVPTIQVNHENGTNFREADHPKQKRLGEIKAYDIPFWGKAADLAKEYR